MNLLLKIAYILILIAAIGFLWFPLYAAYVMAVGCAASAIYHLRENYNGNSLRLKRIYRMRRVWLSILFLAASYFMFREGMLWVPLILLCSLLELYTLWVIDREEKA